MFQILLIAAMVTAVAAVWLLVGVVRRWRFGRRVARSQALFPRQRHEAQDAFHVAAAGSGKPRGLIWKECTFHEPARFALDRTSGEIFALLPVTIRFEAVAGGPMEEVEAVGNLRSATAVFVYRNGGWTSDGRAVFNLDPAETLQHYKSSLMPLSD